jgi:NAD(P)-dependent dehydrogenase (short-subunit alcohol dehydrogenase family)
MLPPPELPHSTMAKTTALLPLKRAVDPMDLARSAVFLLTCESLTGSLLPVDCGQSAARRLKKKLI